METNKKPYVIGIDVGGTNTAFGIVDARGNILASSKETVKTQKHQDVNKYIDELYDELSKLIKESCGIERIQGIGVGAPNANYYSGQIEYAANLPWKGIIPLSKILTDKFGVPTALTNDANAAAIGEMTYGVARGMKNFIMITLGTGVGSGIVANGQLIYGHDSFAGELGHVIVRRENGRPCGCGNSGCLETYTSATGVANTAREFLAKRANETSLLRKIPAEQITSLNVTEAAFAGDQIAQDVYTFTGQILGEAFADFVKFSSPEAIILFGGLAKAGDLLLVPICKAMEQNLLINHKGKIKILFSEMKDADAAILGASALGWEAK